MALPLGGISVAPLNAGQSKKLPNNTIPNLSFKNLLCHAHSLEVAHCSNLSCARDALLVGTGV